MEEKNDTAMAMVAILIALALESGVKVCVGESGVKVCVGESEVTVCGSSGVRVRRGEWSKGVQGRVG